MRRMPCHEIDDSALAEDREGDLRGEAPSTEPARDLPRYDLMQPRVPSIHEPVELDGSPPCQEFDPDVQARRNPADRVEREWSRMPALEPRDRGLRDPGLGCQILLPPAAPLPDSTN